jgi:hypothetical protein
MGVCTAKPESRPSNQQKLNEEIEKQQAECERKDASFKKLLLLGAGESGKSTLFKQCQVLYGNGFDSQYIQDITKHVHLNCWVVIKVLIQTYIFFICSLLSTTFCESNDFTFRLFLTKFISTEG